MKKLLIILLLVSFNSFGQDVKVTVKKEKSIGEAYNDGLKTQAEVAKAKAAVAAAMSDTNSNIKVPLEIDLNNYTVTLNVDSQEIEKRFDELKKAGGFKIPKSQTPWQQYFRVRNL